MDFQWIQWISAIPMDFHGFLLLFHLVGGCGAQAGQEVADTMRHGQAVSLPVEKRHRQHLTQRVTIVHSIYMCYWHVSGTTAQPARVANTAASARPPRPPDPPPGCASVESVSTGAAGVVTN